MPALDRRALLRSLSAPGLVLVGGCASNTDGSESTGEPVTTESTVGTTDETLMEPTVEAGSPSFGAGPGPLPEKSWPLTHRSASNCPLLPDGPSFADDVREDWHEEPIARDEEDPSSPEFSGPVVSDGQVIVANRLRFTPNNEAPDTQLVRAFDAGSGEQTWKYTIGSQSDPAVRDIPTTPAVWGDTVLVGQGQTVRAVDVGDGTESWRRSLGTQVHAVVPERTRTYIRAHRSIIALSTDNNVVWTTPLEEFPETLAVGHRHVYVSVSRKIHALDPEDGAKRWSVELPAVEGGYALSRLVAVEGGIIAIQNSGTLSAFDENGERCWRADTRYNAFVTDGIRVYARSAGTLRALGVHTGERLWELTCSDRPSCESPTKFGPAVLAGDSLVAVLDDGGLLGVTPAIGTLRWSLDDGPRFENLALGPDALYGVGDGGTRLSRIVSPG
jgi:outer membrane protein assembly factor BamB